MLPETHVQDVELNVIRASFGSVGEESPQPEAERTSEKRRRTTERRARA